MKREKHIQTLMTLRKAFPQYAFHTTAIIGDKDEKEYIMKNENSLKVRARYITVQEATEAIEKNDIKLLETDWIKGIDHETYDLVEPWPFGRII